MDERSLEIEGKFHVDSDDVCSNRHTVFNPQDINKIAETVQEDINSGCVISECECLVDEKSQKIEGKFCENPINSQDINKAAETFQEAINSGCVSSECESSVDENSLEIEGRFCEDPINSQDINKTADTLHEAINSGCVISECKCSVDEKSLEIEGKFCEDREPCSNRHIIVHPQDINKTAETFQEAINSGCVISECESSVDEKLLDIEGKFCEDPEPCSNRPIIVHPQDINKTAETFQEAINSGCAISGCDCSVDEKSLEIEGKFYVNPDDAYGNRYIGLNPEDINKRAETVQKHINSGSLISKCEFSVGENSLEIEGKFYVNPDDAYGNINIGLNPEDINKRAETVQEHINSASLISECEFSVGEKSLEIEGKCCENAVNSQDTSKPVVTVQEAITFRSVISECEFSVGEKLLEIEGKFCEDPVNSQDINKTAETFQEAINSSSLMSECECLVDEKSRKIEGKFCEDPFNSQDTSKTVVTVQEAINSGSVISECKCSVDEKAPETTETTVSRVERKSSINKFITSIFKVPWQVNMGKDSKRETDNVVAAGRKGDGIKIESSEAKTSTDCGQEVENQQEHDVSKNCDVHIQERDITVAKNNETETIESVDCSLCNREEQADVRTRLINMGLFVRERAETLINSDSRSNNDTEFDMKHEDSSERSLLNIGSTIKRFNPFGKLPNFNFTDVYSQIFKNIVLPKEVDNALALFFDKDDDENVEDLDLESDAKALCLDPKLMDVSEFEDCVTKKMKEDGGLIYKNFDDEEILLKYDALPPVMSLRKVTLKDENDSLELKIETKPCSSVSH